MTQSSIDSVAKAQGSGSGRLLKKERLLGAWSLVSCVSHRSDGQVTFPYGEQPAGMLFYDAESNFSGQIQGQGRPEFESGNLLRGTSEEIKAAFEGYVAYYGKYEVDEEAGRLTHHVLGSLFPNWVGQYQTRLFNFEPDAGSPDSGNPDSGINERLVLTTLPFVGKRVQVTLTLIWKRSG